MKLTVVGCAGSFPRADSACSCYLVEHDGFRLVLDMGNGALGALQSHTDLLGIDAVLLSHLHADHCLDLCSTVVTRRYHPSGPAPRLPLWGPAGTHDRLAAAYDPTDTAGLHDVFDVDAVSAGVGELGPFRLTFALVNHPVETYAVRVEAGGRSVVYSGDTAESDALVSLARGADLFLCEATFDDPAGRDAVPNPPGLHLTGESAGAHAERAGVGKLLLTHIPAWSDVDRTVAEASTSFTGKLAAVRPGDTWTL